MADNQITPEFRAAFISVFKATSMKNADGSVNKPKYSIRACFPPTAKLDALKKEAQLAAQEKWGDYKVQGVNFSTTEPISDRIRAEGRKPETARVTEIMATELLAVFEDKSITIEVELDGDARDDLRKPEKITSPGGRVSIAATRDEAGHADHFWGLALAVRASGSSSGPFAYQKINLPGRNAATRSKGLVG